MNGSLQVDAIEMVEWYDGLVSGIVHTAENAFFIYLLAFAPDLRKRKFAVLPINTAEVRLIQTAVKSKQIEEMQLSLSSLKLSDRPILWTNDEPEIGRSLALHEFKSDEILKIEPPILPCIDRATTEVSIGHWL